MAYRGPKRKKDDVKETAQVFSDFVKSFENESPRGAGGGGVYGQRGSYGGGGAGGAAPPQRGGGMWLPSAGSTQKVLDSRRAGGGGGAKASGKGKGGGGGGGGMQKTTGKGKGGSEAMSWSKMLFFLFFSSKTMTRCMRAMSNILAHDLATSVLRKFSKVENRFWILKWKNKKLIFV